MEDSNMKLPAVRTAPPPLWRMKDGRLIPIPDMTDSHLTNTIRMCIRNVESIRWRAREPIENYLGGNPPQHAEDAAEQALAELEGMSILEVLVYCSKPFPDLLREARDRKLPIWREICQLYVEHVQGTVMSPEEIPLYDLNNDD